MYYVLFVSVPMFPNIILVSSYYFQENSISSKDEGMKSGRARLGERKRDHPIYFLSQSKFLLFLGLKKQKPSLFLLAQTVMRSR